MEVPQSRFTTAADGTSLAYAVFGAGEVTVLTSGLHMWSNLGADWERPGMRRLYELVSGFCRVVYPDQRNTGLSDPGHPTGTLEDAADDFVRVLDAAGVDRTALLSGLQRVPVALAAAARHPDRFDQLVLLHGWARFLRDDDYPVGIPRDIVERGSAAIVEAYETGELDELGGPGTGSMWRSEGLSPGRVRSHIDWHNGLDARRYLPNIIRPVLFVSLSNPHPNLPRLGPEWLIDALDDVRSVTLDTNDSHFRFLDTRFLDPNVAEVLAGHVEEFLTGRRTGRAAERRVATVMFTDIVSSTETAAAIGDGAWRERIASHDRVTRRTIERHGGIYVKSTGDGALATFDLPMAALEAIEDLHRSLAAEGIHIRAGAHSGVIEDLDGDITGMTVNIAARCQALAEPGETVVTQPVLDGAGDDDYWEALGLVELKGVSRPWPLYRTPA